MKPDIKNLFIATAVVTGTAAATVAAFAGLTKYLMDVAMDRDAPKSVKKARHIIEGHEKKASLFDELEKKSEALSKIPFETIHINSTDGIELTGHFIKSAYKSKRLVIAVHGWRSKWHKDFGLISDFLDKSGCDVLYIEQRGQNNSGGDYMTFGMLERFDVAQWANYADENLSKGLPIYLCGLSMGASTVLMASALDLPRRVRGIIADCGFTSANEIWKHVMENNMHLPYPLMRGFADFIFRQKANTAPSACSTIEALKDNTRPILFVHGADDHFVPVEMTYRNYEACTVSKRLVIVPGADHAMSYYVDQELYEKAVKDFWKQYD